MPQTYGLRMSPPHPSSATISIIIIIVLHAQMAATRDGRSPQPTLALKVDSAEMRLPVDVEAAATHGAAWLPAPESARQPSSNRQRSLPQQRSLAGVDGDDINLQHVFTEDPGMVALARSLAQGPASAQLSSLWANRPSVAPDSVITGGLATRKRTVSFSLDAEDSLTFARSRERSSSLADWSEDVQPTNGWQTDDSVAPPPGAGGPRADTALPRPGGEPQPSISRSSETVSADADLDDDSPLAFQRRLERELAQQLDRHRVDSAQQLQALQLGKLGHDGEALPPPLQLMSLHTAPGLRRAPSGDVSRVYRARVGPELRATCPMLCAAFPYGSTACVSLPRPRCLYVRTPRMLLQAVQDPHYVLCCNHLRREMCHSILVRSYCST